MIAKYFCRRFFRIYLVFAIFWTALFVDMSYGANIIRGYALNEYRGYWSGLLLSANGRSHLWTVPCEIKFYFFIPIICLAAIKSGRLWLHLWIMTAVFICLQRLINQPGFTSLDYDHEYGYKLWTRLDIFLLGSQLAIVYYKMEKEPVFVRVVAHPTFKRSMSIALVVLFNFQFRSSVIQNQFQGAVLASLMIFAMLFADTFGPASAFFNNDFLRSCGKYSFGIYLFHPMVIEIYIRLVSVYPLKATFLFDLAAAVFSVTYLVGLLWFHLLEDRLIKLASKCCKRIEAFSLFRDNYNLH
jgi:peptidoglycan/LPS O-acetylase OafA/YrhL